MADKIVYIHFTGGAAYAANTNKTWNNSNHPTTGMDIADLDDSTGTATGWGFNTEDSGSIGYTSGGYDGVGTGDADWVDEADISYYFQYLTTTTAYWAFDSLNNSLEYDFEFYCSYTTADYETEFSLDDSTYEAANYSYNNNSATTSITNVSPTAGVINVYWRRVSGRTGAVINAMKITEHAATGGASIIPQGALSTRQILQATKRTGNF